jgi:Cysteine dioxygenase type I
MLHHDAPRPAPRRRSGGDRRGSERPSENVRPAAIARRLAPALHWPGALEVRERSWKLVARTPDFDAWPIAWPRGGKVELHDHGDSSGAVSVIAGTLVEAVPWREDSGRLSLVRNELRPGSTLGFGTGHVHDVTNESDEYAFSLHVYSPALVSMTFYELSGGRLVAGDLRWAYEGREDREAEATAL